MSSLLKFKFRYIAQLLVPDVAASAQWYQTYLGLSMGRKCWHGDRLTYAHLEQAGRDCLLLQNISVFQELGYLPQGVSFEGFVIKVKVEGLSHLREHLFELLPDVPAIATRNGQRECRVRDLDGYVLAFMESDE